MMECFVRSAKSVEKYENARNKAATADSSDDDDDWGLDDTPSKTAPAKVSGPVLSAPPPLPPRDVPLAVVEEKLFQSLEMPSFEGMAMQSAGFVRTPMTNAMGFVRSAKKHQEIQQPVTLPPPPPPRDYDFGPQMPNVNAQPLQYGNLPQLPAFFNAPGSNMEGMEYQSGGFVRPANINTTRAQPPRQNVQTPQQIQLASPLHQNLSTKTAPPQINLNVQVPAAASKYEFDSKASWTYYCVMSENEQKRELKNLFELYSRGFLQEFEYEERKKDIERLSQSAGGYKPRKDTSNNKPNRRGRRKERSVRVFLSSTFRDMQKERDELVKRVFPVLKQECSSRGIFFTEVDLRWGITAEQSEKGEVLALCLQEIDKCRPYFVNFIGNRYGYVPAAIPASLRTIYPFLPNTDAETNERSVTEFEIMHGALNDIANANRAHFYFKSDQLAAQEGPGDHPEKVAALKSRIRNTAGTTAKEYNTTAILADMILRDLRGDIDADFPVEEDPDPLEMEAMSHETYAEIRAKVYIGKSEYFNKLYQYLNDDTALPMLLLGESGSGKSSLLANFCLRHQADPANDNDLVLLHFAGTTPSSADYTTFLRRVVKTIKTSFNVPDEIPADSRTLVRDFPVWLANVPETKRLILVIDALNQFDNADGAHSLTWLPTNQKLPSRVKVIVSTLKNSQCYSVLMERNYQVMNVEPLEREERETLAIEYLALFGKSLDHQQLQRLCIAPQTKNPLFLRATLEELRLHGVYEEINEKIDFYLAANDVAELYEKILSRLEKDFGVTLVRNTMSYLWVSRRGLTESALIEILGITRMQFSPFFFAIQESLVSRSGLYNFFHDYLRQAVEKRYVNQAMMKTNYHLDLASYFEKAKCAVERKAEELPYHLCITQTWSRLKTCLCDIDLFMLLSHKSKKYELKGYWLLLQKQGFDVVSSYELALRDVSQADVPKLAKVYARVGRFLREMIKYEGAEKIMKVACAMNLQLYGNEHINTAKTEYLMAELYWNQSKWAEAEPHCQRSLAVREKLLGPDHLDVAMSLMGIGEMEMRKEGHGNAKPLIERALRIRVAKFGYEHPLVARCLQDLAIIADNSGNFEKAVQLCSQAVRIREKSNGPNHPHTATSLEVLGSIYALKKEAHMAEPLIKRAIDINLQIHGEMHPSVVSCYEWYVLVLKELNRIDEAEEYQKKVKRLEAVLGEVGERIAD
eukprot:TRINITY_DN3020_c0_g2_i1.p1 TRINITY_DN3020_c0_g2~~TRINITY_DN3020_c0_g2_i1.p1  ORF type:complete len:1203 (-),score=303.44 TRINITY_DN3020_c0_g2_i1:33-3641(-)